MCLNSDFVFEDSKEDTEIKMEILPGFSLVDDDLLIMEDGNVGNVKMGSA